MVAVNVATALAQLQKDSTLFIDLHVANGDAAVFLGSEPKFSIVDALENSHRMDEAFFRGLIAKTKAGVDLLASSDRVIVAPIDVRRVRALIDFAARHYRYIVLDVPRTDAAVLEALCGRVTNRKLGNEISNAASATETAKVDAAYALGMAVGMRLAGGVR